MLFPLRFHARHARACRHSATPSHQKKTPRQGAVAAHAVLFPLRVIGSAIAVLVVTGRLLLLAAGGVPAGRCRSGRRRGGRGGGRTRISRRRSSRCGRACRCCRRGRRVSRRAGRRVGRRRGRSLVALVAAGEDGGEYGGSQEGVANLHILPPKVVDRICRKSWGCRNSTLLKSDYSRFAGPALSENGAS
ncbi:hypothetical protein Hsero_1660 [Herbaspirillum seropedicae SmR1]|uniref:Uncharacterized protein n=1 Tax=Herbaspirillum seropedicae (strain SmR1) TaxID=757424 RepID=D8IQR2_HERSS|nr:hypothetical protein Hsero_1660 [Herbaspirillum seropedicae SmR1]